MRAYEGSGIPGVADLATGKGGFPLLRVHNDYAECDIYLYGAHISRFEPQGQGDLLWMSPTGAFEEGFAIRGGIPVCFPWFGPHRTRGDLPLHGLARNRFWNLERTARLDDGRTLVVLSLSDDEATRGIWPYRFGLELHVVVGRELEATLISENQGEDPFRYEDCFHTYFRVSAVQDCEITGLDGISYIDRVQGDRRAVQKGGLRLRSETVNAYMRAPARCELRDRPLGRSIVVEQRGFASIVVWNPGEAAAAKNPEIGAAWNEYICVESANCLDTPILLLPGTAHRSRLRIRLAAAGPSD